MDPSLPPPEHAFAAIHFLADTRLWDEDPSEPDQHWDEVAPGYELVVGRRIKRDPAGDVDSANLYLYVNNRPTVMTDPTGLIQQLSFRIRFRIFLDTFNSDGVIRSNETHFNGLGNGLLPSRISETNSILGMSSDIGLNFQANIGPDNFEGLASFADGQGNNLPRFMERYSNPQGLTLRNWDAQDINVYIVENLRRSFSAASLANADDPSKNDRTIRAVTRPAWMTARPFIALSVESLVANPNLLAHELGHYILNSGALVNDHEMCEGTLWPDSNLMSEGAFGRDLALRQKVAIRRGARQLYGR